MLIDREEVVIAVTRTWSWTWLNSCGLPTSLEMARLSLFPLRLFSRPRSSPSSFPTSIWYHYSHPRVLGHKLYISNHCIMLSVIFHMGTEESVRLRLDAKEDTWHVLLGFGQEVTGKMSDR